MRKHSILSKLKVKAIWEIQVYIQINNNSVKANEVTVVSALIEEKSRLAEEKDFLRKIVAKKNRNLFRIYKE